MESFHKKVHMILGGLFVALIGIDQLIKYIIMHVGHVEILCNYGVAFGLILPQIAFFTLWGAIMAFVIYYWYTKRSASVSRQLPFVLIVSGGVSNMIDRILCGCVIDYVPFLTISSFNFADALISFGAFLWLRQLFVERTKH
jgi:signal peptidase II